MTRNRITAAIAAAVIAIVAVVLTAGGASSPIATAEGAIAWWLTRHASTTLAVGVVAILTGAVVLAVTQARRHRDG